MAPTIEHLANVSHLWCRYIPLPGSFSAPRYTAGDYQRSARRHQRCRSVARHTFDLAHPRHRRNIRQIQSSFGRRCRRAYARRELGGRAVPGRGRMSLRSGWNDRILSSRWLHPPSPMTRTLKMDRTKVSSGIRTCCAFSIELYSWHSIVGLVELLGAGPVLGQVERGGHKERSAFRGPRCWRYFCIAM